MKEFVEVALQAIAGVFLIILFVQILTGVWNDLEEYARLQRKGLEPFYRSMGWWGLEFRALAAVDRLIHRVRERYRKP